MNPETDQDPSDEPDQRRIFADGQNVEPLPANDNSDTGANGYIHAKWISSQAQTIEMLAKDLRCHSVRFAQKLVLFTGTSSTSSPRSPNTSNTCNGGAHDVLPVEPKVIFHLRCRTLKDSFSKLKRNIKWSSHMQEEASKFQRDTGGTLILLHFAYTVFLNNR